MNADQAGCMAMRERPPDGMAKQAAAQGAETPHDKGSRFVAEIPGLKTQFDVLRFMRRVTEAFGARAFMVLNLPSKTSLELAANSIISNWPAELLSLYDREGMLQSSPLLRRLRQNTTPFTFDLTAEDMERPGMPRDQAIGMFGRFNMIRGAYFPTHDVTGLRGAVSFLGDRAPFSLDEMMALAFLSTAIYDRLADIRKADGEAPSALTDREIDCLNWTAAGKTSAEIAEILRLSEHTVNHYLNRATKKLDTVNRTQAVATALRQGIIK